ncbi:MAG: hypothetical protein HY815_12225 [Candidatus Riflebacteria bacterium]|nr:hypothetical protein [Candidatus Riflebacteria bacterium]
MSTSSWSSQSSLGLKVTLPAAISGVEPGFFLMRVAGSIFTRCPRTPARSAVPTSLRGSSPSLTIRIVMGTTTVPSWRSSSGGYQNLKITHHRPLR